MEIKQLKRFLDLCETRSFTGTAENLFLSQQALSCSINALEKELGRPLFKRTSRGTVLTEEGEYLRSVCAPVIQRFDEMSREVNRYFQGQEEPLYMGLAPGVLQASSADLIYRFRTAYPNYEVRAVEDTDAACLEKVMEEKVELSFCPRPPKDSCQELSYIPVGSEPLYAVVNNGSPLASRKELNLSELREERLVSLNKYYQIHHLLLSRFREQGFTPEFLVETGETGTLLGLVKLGGGVFVCMEHVALGTDRESCTAVPLSDSDLAWEYGLVFKKNRKLSVCARRFIEFVARDAKG